MNKEQLAAVEARAKRGFERNDSPVVWETVGTDVPALVAEVRRLQSISPMDHWFYQYKRAENAEARVKESVRELDALRKVAKAAEWVLQDPALTCSNVSSEPYEQSIDSRGDLDEAIAAWREVAK